VFLTHVAVQYAGGSDETYVLPIVARPTGADFDPMRVTPHAVIGRLSGARSGYLLDASSDPGTARVLLELVSSAGTRRSKRGSVQGEAAEALPGLMAGVDLTPRHLTSDQSNTALVFGETLFLKLYRRFEAGENPDLEIVRHLAAAGFRNIAPYGGSLLYRAPDQAPGAVAMLQGFVANEINGWEHAVDELQRFFDRVHTVVRAPDPQSAAGPTPPAAITDAIGTYFAAAKRLGTRTGEMHAALAAAHGNTAFDPEPLTPERLARMAASMRTLAEATLLAIDARRESLPAHLAPLAGEFLGRRERLLAEFEALATLAPHATVTRVHGDFHLGQLLWSRGDCIFLDFEGEPARPLAERREKQSPLKDVAGMMRSFSYASHAALYAWSQSRPHDFDRLEPWARVWAHWASAAFLDAWRQAVGAAGFAPKDAASFDRLLRVFLLEKACYEIQYEINNRPEWVRIPLVGVLALARDNGQP
jgi:maltose alpha-D-glucosyltransferase/alpha-amylase